MPYLYRSFSAKEPYNLWLFCDKSPATKGILWIFATMWSRHVINVNEAGKRTLKTSTKTSNITEIFTVSVSRNFSSDSRQYVSSLSSVCLSCEMWCMCVVFVWCVSISVHLFVYSCACVFAVTFVPRETTWLCVYHDVLDVPGHTWLIRVTIIHMCVMTDSYLRHDSLVRVIWLIHTCDMTHWYVTRRVWRALQHLMSSMTLCGLMHSFCLESFLTPYMCIYKYIYIYTYKNIHVCMYVCV